MRSRPLKLIFPVVAIVVGGIAVVALPGLASDGNQMRVSSLSSARCISSPVVNLEIVSDNKVRVQDRQGRIAVLTLTGPCVKNRNDTVALEFASGLSTACRASELTVIGSAATTMPLTCNVKSIKFED